DPPDQATTSSVSVFSYGDRVLPEVSLTDFQWPDLEAALGLVNRYFEFASPTYRVLHQPTVESSLGQLYSQLVQDGSGQSQFMAAPPATLLLIFSTATMFQVSPQGKIRDADDPGWRTSELYYVKADSMLAQEAGAPSLASVQARFLMVLYLLCTSRAHKAWYVFGTTVQLIMALGLHSPRPKKAITPEDEVQKECKCRIVWCSYTLDRYLSIILGRPRLWQDEDLKIRLPMRVNDPDLTPQGIQVSGRDCTMDAPYFHTKLAQILTQAAKEDYLISGISSKTQIDTIGNLCSQVAEWKSQLPPFLSGIIHPSSLAPLFRRQLTVLKLARYHALMFITRPLLLRNYGQIWPDCEASYQYYLSVCLKATEDTIKFILAFVQEEQLFPAFWYSQYITFNALSIIYIFEFSPHIAGEALSGNPTFPPVHSNPLRHNSRPAYYLVRPFYPTLFLPLNSRILIPNPTTMSLPTHFTLNTGRHMASQAAGS
ncbi:hypothetical protein BO71DRAFT_336974, partial [Aspergillus ellipticus CBS 707.79]